MSDVGWGLYSDGSLVLSLVPDGTSSTGYWFDTLADGWDLGSPEAVKAVFASLAADGDDERIMRHGNRSVPFRVRVRGGDLASVGEGERALRLALNLAPDLELRYTPPDGLGAVTVFDVVLAEMANQPDDLALVWADPWADYAVTLTCAPFVRPPTAVTVSLTYGTDAGTSLDAGTSTAAWSSSDGTLSAVTVNTETAIALALTVPAGSGSARSLSRTSLALTAAKPYIAVGVAASPDAGTTVSTFQSDVTVALGSTNLGPPVAVDVQPTTGFLRYFFPHTFAGTSQTVTVTIRGGGLPSNRFYVDGLYAYSTAPGTGLLVADVEGSERAPMTVAVSRTAASSLGPTFLYTDPTMLEDGWNPGDPATWPNAPAGPYVAVIPSAGVAGTSYSMTINGQSSYTLGASGVNARFFAFSLGARRDGRLGTITSDVSTSTYYLFRDEPGETSLMFLSNITGRYLFVDSPTIADPRGIQAWSGNASDGSDAVSMVSLAEVPDTLVIKPPRFALWTKSAADITVAATYYPRSHTFVPPTGLVS